MLVLLPTLLQGCCIPLPFLDGDDDTPDLPEPSDGTTPTETSEPKTKEPTEPTDSSTTTDEGKIATADTAMPVFFGARRFSVGADFAFDGSGIYTPDNYGNPIEPYMYITIARPNWRTNDFTDVANYCQFLFPLDSATDRPEVSSDSRLWWAVDWNDTLDPVIDTCDQQGYILDPKYWGSDLLNGGGKVTGGMLTHQHFVGLGERTAAIDMQLKKAKGFEDAVGGVLSTPFEPFQVGTSTLTQVDDAYSFGFEIDGNDELETDSSGFLISIPRNDVFNGSDVSKGYYRVRALGWQWI